MEKNEIKKSINKLVEEYFKTEAEQFVPGKTKVRVGGPIYDDKEVNRAIECLLTTWISQGKNVLEFEQEFAKYCGTKYAISVNSGSSANLVATLAPLVAGRIKKGAKVVVPATTFPTTLTPVIQAGLKPVLVDVDPETYNIDMGLIPKKEKIDMVIPVHLFGNPVDVKKLKDAVPGAVIIEDCAEAHGAEMNGKKVGSLGDAGTFSFFVSHHMTTAEGGMIVTNDKEYNSVARSLRAFGRFCVCNTCNVAKGLKCVQGDRLGYSDDVLKNYDVRYLFTHIGYSLKMIETSGAFGIEQLKKLPGFIDERIANAEYYINGLKKYKDSLHLPKTAPGGKHTYFGFPIAVTKEANFTRKDITEYLEGKQIETRPFMGGNLADQPAFRNVEMEVGNNLPVARWLRDCGFFIGCHPGIKKEERKYVVDVIKAFMEKSA